MSLKCYLDELFNGKILYNELSMLNENLALQAQVFSLSEDLLQVESVDKELLLDVGWYPEFDLDGFFKVVVIKKYDWENPIFDKKILDISSLESVLRECKLKYNF